mmetsp:Transcript_11618/g.46797  ORF Transcript_11618/g.46797 Transcript_11618/m.46797 type:complete len:205 (+) Transcript_11618:1141-1755(+)
MDANAKHGGWYGGFSTRGSKVRFPAAPQTEPKPKPEPGTAPAPGPALRQLLHGPLATPRKSTDPIRSVVDVFNTRASSSAPKTSWESGSRFVTPSSAKNSSSFRAPTPRLLPKSRRFTSSSSSSSSSSSDRSGYPRPPCLRSHCSRSHRSAHSADDEDDDGGCAADAPSPFPSASPSASESDEDESMKQKPLSGRRAEWSDPRV